MEVGLKVGSGPCLFGTYKSTLTSNSQAKDVITNSTPMQINPEGPCTGVSIAGTFTEATIAASGKLKITASPALAITVGACTYEASKLSASFTVPTSAAFADMSVKAKRSKASPKTCAKSATYEGGVAIGAYVDSHPSDYELEAT